MARPDITELGESLLSGKIERVRKQEKEAKSFAKSEVLKTLGLQIGMGVANDYFKRDAEDFLQNENVLAAKAKHNAALKESERVFLDQKAIDQYDG